LLKGHAAAHDRSQGVHEAGGQEGVQQLAVRQLPVRRRLGLLLHLALLRRGEWLQDHGSRQGLLRQLERRLLPWRAAGLLLLLVLPAVPSSCAAHRRFPPLGTDRCRPR
jgi:hypothetical protein